MFELSHSEIAPLLEGILPGGECPEGRVIKIEPIRLEIQGVIARGLPSTKAPTCASLSLAMVGEILRQAGCTREAGIAAIVAAANGTLKETPESRGWAETARAEIAAKGTPTPVAGRRTGSVCVTVV